MSLLSSVACSTVAAATLSTQQGETNRVIGEHQLNRASSRSHCIFCLELQLVPEGGNGQALVRAGQGGDVGGLEAQLEIGGS
jgi:kinesin family protein 6/9